MAVTQEEKKYVAFQLGNEYYAINVHAVSEVFIPSGAITPIPNAPNHVAGVINFRGNIVSVIDLKQRLQITQKGSREAAELDEDRIYVVIVRSGDSTIGLLVDYVDSVISISNENVQSTLDLISDQERTQFIEGVARTTLGLTILLSLVTVLADYDAREIEKLAQIRERLIKEQDTDEVVVTSDQLLDLDHDDVSDYEALSRNEPQFRQVAPTSRDNIGTSPLDLGSLTKAELLQIAMEMEIDTISTKSKKDEIINAINQKMGNA